jgi:hypothetical protein
MTEMTEKTDVNSSDGPNVARCREFNMRLYRQYGAMLMLVWMGATFEGEALARWTRLRLLYG